MNNLEQKLEDLFLNKMPALPANVRETAAKVVPWLIVILGSFALLGWVSSIRFFFGFSGMLQHIPGYVYPDIFIMLSLVVAPIVQIMSIYGGYLMLSRQRKGWRIVLYALLIGLIPHILSFSILGIILNIAFAYLLFQIKEYNVVDMAS